MDRKLGHGPRTATAGRLTLRFTWLAIEDLARLRAFIAKENPHAARRIARMLRRSIARLVDHPHIGHSLNDSSLARQWVAGNYVVHYLLDDVCIVVLRVWHGRERQ